MAKIIENPKGFKVIEVSLDEVKEKFGGFGICDMCNSFFQKLMYVPVLDYCCCQECYDQWTETAIRYSEDVWFEDKMLRIRKKQLEIK